MRSHRDDRDEYLSMPGPPLRASGLRAGQPGISRAEQAAAVGGPPTRWPL